jgi:hypothetical protein
MALPAWQPSSVSFSQQAASARQAHGLTLTGEPNPVSMAIAELALLAIPGAPILRAARGSRLLAALSHMRRPLHSSLAKGMLTQGRVSPWITRSLKVRKGAGAAALGYNLLHPFETIRHAQKGDYDKAVINLFYPIVGVPIYDLVEGSSSQDLVQNGGPPAPLLVSSTNADILSLGKISRPTRSSSAKRVTNRVTLQKPKQCPRGHRWRFGYDPAVGYPRFHCMKTRKRS